MKPKDLKDKPPHILIYGAAGTGKTALVTQAKNAYCMDFDNGMLTARNLQDKFTPIRHNIEFDTYKDYNLTSPTAWMKAKTKLTRIAEKAHRGTWEFDALVIDSITGMGRQCQNQIFFDAGLLGKPLGAHGLKLYGFIVAELENYLQIITALPCLTIVVTHELPITVGAGEAIETSLKPRIVGTKLPSRLPEFFDEVWYTMVKKQGQDFIASWKPRYSRESRTRSGKFQELVHNNIGLAGLLKEVNFIQKERIKNGK